MKAVVKLGFSIAGLLMFLLWVAANRFNTEETLQTPENASFDAIIYGATPSGIAAALGAVDTLEDARVAILEPTNSIGGVTTQGIGLRDFHYAEVMRSTMLEWGMLNAQHYNVTYPVWQPDNHVGMMSYKVLLKSRGVDVYLGEHLEQSKDAIQKSVHDDRVVTAIRTFQRSSLASTTWSAKYFVDASYEGDLLRFSGASYTVGREAKHTYNEPRGGVTTSSLGNFKVDVDPIGPDGKLLPLVNGFGPSGEPGDSDEGVMAYSMRVCVTKNASKRAPFQRPRNYNASMFELLARYYRAGGKSVPYSTLPYRDYPDKDKYDICDNGEAAPISTDAAGWGIKYPTATYAERDQIAREHQNYVAGMFWFLQTDSSVPKALQARTKNLGLCKDEWPENGHWPQLYVREGIRLVSDKVFTQVDCDAAAKHVGNLPVFHGERAKTSRRVMPPVQIAKAYEIPCHENSVGLGGWGYDVHIIRRYAEKIPSTGNQFRYRARNEGQTAAFGGAGFFELPRSLIEPKHSELSNLLVTSCVAASHVTFSALREEPSLWQLGQAAGTIIALALDMKTESQVAVGAVPNKALQRALIRQGNAVHWPPRDHCAVQTTLMI